MKKQKTKTKIRTRKMQVIDLFEASHIEFLMRRVDKNVPHLASRSAILRHLVDQAMEDPDLLD